MPRTARLVIPDIPHHVTQRGNRRMPVFFSDQDRRFYCALLAKACADQQTRCIAWCLIDNHIHLILVPDRADGLRATLGETHRRYTSAINKREGWTGFLFQGRFASYPMDESHLMNAVRYVENNPVTAGLCALAEDWPWSSARAHVTGNPDLLTDLAFDFGGVTNWSAMLAEGLVSADKEIEARLHSGAPLGQREWISTLEAQLGVSFAPQKRGPKPRPNFAISGISGTQ